MTIKKQRWFTDYAYGSVRPSYLVNRTLIKTHSKYQSIEILETSAYGRALFLGGDMQLTEKDEFIYHEMMSHVPLFSHGSAKSILIIGGGDGGTLREVLKHNVEQVTVVEIDERVVEICREFLPSVGGKAFEDPRCQLVIGDGIKYVLKSEEHFDVILVDSTDRLGTARPLYTEKFYKACKSRLRPDGILVNQIGMPFFFPDFLRLMHKRRAPHFAQTGAYLATVPSYYGGSIGFGWASRRERRQDRRFYDQVEKRFRRARLETRYYSPEVHRSSFTLPPMLLSYLTQ